MNSSSPLVNPPAPLRSRECFSPAQLRAARALLGWTQDELAHAARLEPEAVELYELAEGDLSLAEMHRLGSALSSSGVIALAANLAGEGVRFSRPRIAHVHL